MAKLISVVTPAYNEEENIKDVYLQVREIFAQLPQYDYEHLFIDNASTDETVNILKGIAQADKHVKIIVNSRNFHASSLHHALLQARGDAVISLVSDLQDPPALMKDFIKKWEEGYKVVVGIKNKSEEGGIMFNIRKLYYFLIKKIADIEQIRNFHGFGLYDREFIEAIRKFDDPDPYFRGMINEVGFQHAELKYTQNERKKGKSKGRNWYTMYGVAMLGFVNHSKLPLRLASFIGFVLSALSFALGLAYLIYKLIYWQRFQLGLAPLIIGFFFLGSMQLFFVGILGEYIAAIYTQVKNRPLVIEKERINFNV
ncbi:glycosyltransferase [Patescibacteria group bacterium]|nr:MAG: glycosyltransferase [Patescibacteria group bacterium]